ncbi:acylneuraminate cytidylyltransferase family protein [Lysinibacillus pakistanensis]|uniref:acylneuraminate cytidylyltransferase family protein n=1 Tax=Lysinibacillus pakistanensis TaxID=759811 RepID=UPI003D2931CB
MYCNKKILAIIPARGGSKGIPKKNIIKINGKPLLQYTIDAAIKSKYIDEIHVSTDDDEIVEVAENLGVSVLRKRPIELAQDNSKSIDVILDVINYYKEIIQQHFDYILLLQPTQPLRQSFHIDEAIEKIINLGAESLVSVSLVDNHPILIRQINKEGKLISILQQTSTVRRQDFESYYVVNGAIYLNKIDAINSHTSLNDNKIPYIMDKKFDIDIDEYFDVNVFKLKLKHLK